MATALHIWMNGVPVGVWTTLRTGTAVLRYHESWVRSEEGRALSLSLPFTADLEHRGPVVTHYFENLLPDSAAIRRRLRRRFHARSEEAFDLLAEIGRDCVGAVQLLPPDGSAEGWNRIEAEPLKDREVEAVLTATTSDAPLGQRDEQVDFRISIAGAQEKTALLRMGGRWHRPRGATPTTHILKLPLGLIGNMRADMNGSVENEWLCSKIMAGLGIPIAATEIVEFGETKALAVERFDRRWQGIAEGAERKARFKPDDGVWIARLPQEDFCQALGVAPDRKYESDGGPSAQACLQILSASRNAEEDRAVFALSQFAFWMLAASDGHAKNFSIRHQRGGSFALTPLYDVISAWPIIGKGRNQLAEQKISLAMAVRAGRNAHYRLGEIPARHWKQMADAFGPQVWGRMTAMAEATERVLEAVETTLAPGFPEDVWKPIADGMRRQAAKFLRAANSGAEA